jgi:intracellular septation protein
VQPLDRHASLAMTVSPPSTLEKPAPNSETMTPTTPTPPAAPTPAIEKAPNPLLKLVLEMGPLVTFFFVNARYDLLAATGAFMVATVLSLSISLALFRRVPLMPLISGGLVMIFGGLTLYLQDELFIKLKPTIVNLLFASVLLGGMAVFKKPLLGYVLDSVMSLTDEGWRKLSWRWGFFFVFLAVLNEFVWRTFPTDFWVSFKVFGIMPITIIFTLSQIPLIQRCQIETEAKAAP